MGWSPVPHVPPKPGRGGGGGGKEVEKPPFIFRPSGWRSTKMSMGHILKHSWLCSDAIMYNPAAQSKVPNEWTQIESSTICSVVERPDHHCGDDFVFFCTGTCNACFCVNVFISESRNTSRVLFLNHLFIHSKKLRQYGGSCWCSCCWKVVDFET